MIKNKSKLTKYLASILAALITVAAFISINVWAQEQGQPEPVKYIKFDPTVYDPTEGGTVKIMWNFELQQNAWVKIFNQENELIRTLVSAKTYPGGFVENSETWVG